MESSQESRGLVVGDQEKLHRKKVIKVILCLITFFRIWYFGQV